MLRGRVFSFLKLSYKTRSLCMQGYYNGSSDNQKFSNDQQNLILDVLNRLTADELINSYRLPKLRAKNLEKWRANKGTFKTLDDVLDVDGFSIKLLERICFHNLINESGNKEKKRPNRNGSKYVSPKYDKETVVNSAVGIYSDINGLSWAKICSNHNRLDNWGFVDLCNVPTNLSIHETFNLAQKVLEEIPPGDVYVFESTSKRSPRMAGGSAYINFVEFMSVLFTLIKTTPRFQSTPNTQTVYYLKPLLFAKLFKILVGQEIVSASNVMKKILEASNQLPCTPVEIDDNLESYYKSLRYNDRELIGQALLLTITFMDLCVYNNQECLDFVASKAFKKEQTQVKTST